MAIDTSYNNFISFFPEFSSETQSDVEAVIKRTKIQINEYKGIDDEEQRELAIFYHVAHNLALRDRALNNNEPGIVKKVSSKQDSIEYAIGEEQTGFQLQSTIYGQQLEELLLGLGVQNRLF